MTVHLAVPSFGIALAEANTVYTISQNNKKIHQHTMPALDELPTKVRRKIYYTKLQFKVFEFSSTTFGPKKKIFKVRCP